MHWQALRQPNPIGHNSQLELRRNETRKQNEWLATINALRREMVGSREATAKSALFVRQEIRFVNRGWWQGTLQDMPSLRTPTWVYEVNGGPQI